MRAPYRKPGKYSLMGTDPIMTKEKLLEIEKKLAKLKKIRPQASEDVRQLSQLGDFSENVEYQLAKGRLRGINQSILNLEKQINRAEIIEPDKNSDRVAVGNKVTVMVNGKEKIFLILGSTETDPQRGIISYSSPIGSALINKKKNDLIKIKIANKEIEYQIINIE